MLVDDYRNHSHRHGIRGGRYEELDGVKVVWVVRR